MPSIVLSGKSYYFSNIFLHTFENVNLYYLLGLRELLLSPPPQPVSTPSPPTPLPDLVGREPGLLMMGLLTRRLPIQGSGPTPSTMPWAGAATTMRRRRRRTLARRGRRRCPQRRRSDVELIKIM